jgi:hypothetical protein
MAAASIGRLPTGGFKRQLRTSTNLGFGGVSHETTACLDSYKRSAQRTWRRYKAGETILGIGRAYQWPPGQRR